MFKDRGRKHLERAIAEAYSLRPITDLSTDLDVALEAKKSKKRSPGGELSTGEFIFGPKKPKFTHSGSQFKQATKRYKEKHKRSIPGRIKSVFGRKEWRECFDAALSASTPLAEELHAEAISQHVMNQSGFDEESLEEMFIGLFEAIGVDQDDDDVVVLEAVDELDEGVKETAKKALKHLGKAAKSVAKDVGKSAIKHGAVELEKHLKGKKTKKGSVGHTLKHAAQGALKQIAKDPSKTKEIAKKGVTKAGRKLIVKGVKKGLKMVFGKLIKTENKGYSLPKESPSYAYDTYAHQVVGLEERRAQVDADGKVKLFHGEIGGVVKYDANEKVYIPDVKNDRAGSISKKAKDVDLDTMVFDSPLAATREAESWLREAAEYNAGDKVKPADLLKIESLADDLKEAMLKGVSGPYDVPPPSYRHPDVDEKFAEAQRIIDHISRSYPRFRDIYWDIWPKSKKSVWVGLRYGATPTAVHGHEDDYAKGKAARLGELAALVKKMGGWVVKHQEAKYGGHLIMRQKKIKNPKELLPAAIATTSSASAPVAGEKAKPTKKGKHSAAALANRPKSVTQKGISKVFVNPSDSTLIPATPEGAVNLGFKYEPTKEERYFRRQIEFMATKKYGAPQGGCWIWRGLDKMVKGGDGRSRPGLRMVRSEDVELELSFDFDPLEEAIKRLPDNYVMEPMRLKKGQTNSTFYGIHEKDQFAWDGNFKNAVYRGTGHGGWDVVPTKEWKALGKALHRNFSVETAATRDGVVQFKGW